MNIDKGELVRLTTELVGMPTENPPADYREIAPYVKALYESIGLETKIVAGDPNKPNVCARLKGTGESDEVLLLSGHTDVVPAGAGWATEPYKATAIDGKLFGRGTVDMKGALAAQFMAAKSIVDSGVKLKGDLYLFATVDDETAGKMGLRYMVEKGFSELGWALPTFHILGEPSNLDLYIAFKGRMWVKITLEGKSAHGGNPSAGINAIEHMAALIASITALSRESHPLMGTDTINIGTIAGGEKVNIVPNACTITVDFRYVAPQTSGEIEAKLQAAIRQTASNFPNIKVKEFDVFERREPVEVRADNRYISSLKEVTEKVLGRGVQYSGVLSAGDAYWTVSNDIPAVFFGPGDLGVAHTNQEFIPLEELYASAEIFRDYIIKLLR